MSNKTLIRFATFHVVFLTLIVPTIRGGSATWNSSPSSGDWNTASNWTPATVPNGSTDVATFEDSNIADISTSDYVFIGSIVFNPGASSYSIIAETTMQGAGVINNSGVTQTFVSGAQDIRFSGNSTAGNNVVYINNGEQPAGYGTIFGGTANAGTATFINKGDSSGVSSAYMEFRDNTSAGQSTIVNESGETEDSRVDFIDDSTASSSTITLEPGAVLDFSNNAIADSARLSADGGTIFFEENSNGQLASVELNNGAVLDLTSHNSTSAMTIGSLEGDATATVRLNGKLSVGGNGLSTTFNGVITQTGSLTKIGNERLILTGANTYRNGTTITGGTLLVQARSGSATGSGTVNVNAGTLAGKGSISGTVTVGTGTGAGAYLAPGTKGPDTLTTSKGLTFKADGRYKCDLSLGQRRADQVKANGVTIESGAQFVLQPKGFQTLTVGTVFTVINNTAATPISGTFDNLADGAIISATAGNKLQASYEGGDGNDLTLTVVT